MITITLPDGTSHDLKPASAVRLINGGGVYGNGSIDWAKEGLPLVEIVRQLSLDDMPWVAAEIDGRLTARDAFISQDCRLRLIRPEDEAGRAIIARTGAFLLAYGVVSLQAGYKRLGSRGEAGQIVYDFTHPHRASLTDADRAQAETHIQTLLAAGAAITAQKSPFYEAIRYFKEQGEAALVQLLMDNDDGGAVDLRLCADFAEPESGLMLPDTTLIKRLHITQAEWLDDRCRVSAELIL